MKENSQSIIQSEGGEIQPVGKDNSPHYNVCTGCTVCNSGEFEEWLSLFVED